MEATELTLEQKLATLGFELVEPDSGPTLPEPSFTERMGGLIHGGAEHTAKKVAGLLQTVGATDAAEALRTAVDANRAADLLVPGSPGYMAAQKEAHPATTTLGAIGESLVETVPMLPLFVGAGAAASGVLKGLSLVPKAGKAAAALRQFISPEKIAEAGLVGGIARTAVHGAVTGAVLGAATEPGRRVAGAAEEAVGFATVAPAFYIAGRVFGGLARGAIRGFKARMPGAERGVRDIPGVVEATPGTPSPTYVTTGETFRQVTDPDTGKVYHVPIEPVVPKEMESVIKVFDNVEEQLRSLTNPENPSGAPNIGVRNENGKPATIQDYATKPKVFASLAEAQDTMDIVVSMQGGLFKTWKGAAGQHKKYAGYEIVKIGEEGYAFGKLKEPIKIAESDIPSLATELGGESEIQVDNTGKVEVKVKSAEKPLPGLAAPERERFRQELLTVKGQLLPEHVEATLVLIDTLADAKIARGELTSREDAYKLMRGEVLPPALKYDKEGVFTPNEMVNFLDDGTVVITFFQGRGNFSSAIHAVRHVFDRRFLSDVEKAAYGKWSGTPYEQWREPEFERTARLFERFFREGFATVREMKDAGLTQPVIGIFKKFKTWLLNIYKDIRGSDINLEMNPEIENIFRKQLGLKEIEPRTLIERRLNNLDAEAAKFEKAGKQEQADEVRKEWDSLNQWARDNVPDETTILETHLSSLSSLMDESSKSVSISKLERELAKLKESEVEGLEDVRTAIEDYRSIKREGLSPEDYAEEKASAFEEIQSALEGLEVAEIYTKEIRPKDIPKKSPTEGTEKSPTEALAMPETTQDELFEKLVAVEKLLEPGKVADTNLFTRLEEESLRLEKAFGAWVSEGWERKPMFQRGVTSVDRTKFRSSDEVQKSIDDIETVYVEKALSEGRSVMDGLQDSIKDERLIELEKISLAFDKQDMVVTRDAIVKELSSIGISKEEGIAILKNVYSFDAEKDTGVYFATKYTKALAADRISTRDKLWARVLQEYNPRYRDAQNYMLLGELSPLTEKGKVELTAKLGDKTARIEETMYRILYGDRSTTEVGLKLEASPVSPKQTAEFGKNLRDTLEAETAKVEQEAPIKADEAQNTIELERREKEAKGMVKTLFQKGRGKVSAEIKERIDKFATELAQLTTTESKLVDLIPVMKHPGEVLVSLFPRWEKVADFLGMGVELTDLVRRKVNMVVDANGRTIYHRMYDKLLNTLTATKTADWTGTHIKFKTGESFEINPNMLGAHIENLKTVNTIVADWHEAAKYLRPAMFDEAFSKTKSTAMWAANLVGLEDSYLNRVLLKLNLMQATAQHVAQQFPRAIRAWRSFIGSKHVGTEALKDVTIGNPDASVTYKDRVIGCPGFGGLDHLYDRDPKLADIAGKILRVFNTPTAPVLDLPVALEAAERLKLSKTDTVLVAQAVADVRETLDFIHYSRRQHYIDTLPESLTPEVKVQRIKKWDADNPYSRNYLPRHREGDMTILATDTNTGKSVDMMMAYGGRKAKQLKVEMEAKYKGQANVKVEAFPSSSAEATERGLSGSRIQATVERVADLVMRKKGALPRDIDALLQQVEDATTPEIATQLRQSLEQKINSLIQSNLLEASNDLAKSTGLRGHSIGRKGEGVEIPGYIKDVRATLANYSQSYSSYMERNHLIRGMVDGLSDLKDTGPVQDFFRKWYSSMLQSPTKFDSIINGAKQATVLKMLTSIKTMATVILDKPTIVAARFGLYAKTPAEGVRYQVEGLRPAKDFLVWQKKVSLAVDKARELAMEQGIPFSERQAIRDARVSVERPESLTVEDLQLALTLQREGGLAPVFSQQIVSDKVLDINRLSPENVTGLSATLNYSWKKALHWATWPLAQVESYGRTATAISAGRMFRAQGASPAEAMRMAGQFTLDGHGYYDPHNIPLFMQKGVGKIAKLPYTFRVFEHHALQSLVELLSLHGNVGKKAALQGIGATLALGGLFTFPFFGTAVKAYRDLVGTDPEAWMRKVATDWTKSERLADVLSYGVLAGVGGPDFSPFSFRNSVEIGRIDWHNLVFGAPGSMVADVAGAVGSALEGDHVRALEKGLPAALSNPVKAYQRYKYGVAGPTGELLKDVVWGGPLKLTGPEALMQAGGFIPVKLEKAWAREETLRADAAYWSNRRVSVYTLIERAINTKDEAALQAAFLKVDAFNEAVMKASPSGGIGLITQQTIQQSLKDKMAKKKGLRALELGGASWAVGR